MEARLAEVNRHRLRNGEVRAVADLEALLAHVRALRAALQPFAAWYDSGEEDEESRPVTLHSGDATIYYAKGLQVQPLTLGDLQRAAAMLGLARDEEATREAQPEFGADQPQ